MDRWGDGEWLPVFGCDVNYYNANGSKYHPEMGVELLSILKKQNRCQHGLQGLGYRMLKDKIDSLIDVSNWFDADILHIASINGELGEFFGALVDSDVILIGPEHLRGMSGYINIKHFIDIDPSECFLQKENIEQRLMNHLNDTGYCVVLLCAGQTSNIIIDDMFDIYGDTITMIDIGSLFEPYVGKSNRTYHNDIINKLNLSNIG